MFITPFLAFSCLFHFASALWPIPRNLQTGTTLLKLSNSSNNFIRLSDISQAPQDLLDAISRTTSRLHSDNLQRLIVGRGESDLAALANAPTLACLTLSLTPNSPPIKSIMEEATKEITERSESYSLTIPDTDKGEATLTASSSLGLLRGLTTFEQLWYQVSGTVYSYQAPVQITNDSPAYVKAPVVCSLWPFTYIFLACFVSRIAGSCWIRQGTCQSFLSINPMSVIILISYLQLCGRWHQTNFGRNEHGQGLFWIYFPFINVLTTTRVLDRWASSIGM